MGNQQTGKAVYIISKEGSTVDEGLQGRGMAGLRLPVAPLDQISVDQGVNLNNSVVALSGSVVFGGGPGLATLSFNSLLPIEVGLPFAHQNTSQYPWIDATTYSDTLKRLASNNVIFRLIVAEADAGGGVVGSLGENRLVWDSPAMISSYSLTDEEGDCLWYQIAFTEYRELKFTQVQRDIGKQFYTSVKNDTLESIARDHRQYGVNWKNLLNLNPKLKQPVVKKGVKPKKVTTQKHRIKVGSKIRMRRPNGVIDSVDTFESRKGLDLNSTNSVG